MPNLVIHQPEAINVGVMGGDLPARRFALGVTALLSILALPPLGISDSMLKLAAILVAMSGTLFLMAGLVFLQKTHYAGVMLLPSAGLILLASQAGSRPAAAIIGALLSLMMAANLATCSCRLNRALGINSCRG